MKKITQRMCMGCNKKKDKRELIRLVYSKDGKITIDKIGKLEGRGAYICDNIDCLERVIKTKRLERAFNVKIKTEIYNELRGVIIDKKN
ncbi:MAG: YlxR family protein [Clostridia bacterium]|nr:YlxR family protein [Clostridia bacterium]